MCPNYTRMLKILSLFCGIVALFSLWSKPEQHTENQPLEHPKNVLEQPEELGRVAWLRDLQEGQKEAAKTGRPMLILFQEVPGCANCTRYGNVTLSHPLVVEAIETFFVPVCIYNNKGGKDGEALKKFNEPSWNNPVVRIVDKDYKDVVLRMDNFRSSSQLVTGMRLALEKQGKIVPQYMELLEEELLARESGLETLTFSMYCFWSGEKAFGNIKGVIETEPGFQDGKEVVRVQFSPKITNKAALEKASKPAGTTACAKNEGFRLDREPKYYLLQKDYRHIPMTTLQACRVNAALGEGQVPDQYLSTRQINRLKAIRNNPKKTYPNMIGRKDLVKAWDEVDAAVKG